MWPGRVEIELRRERIEEVVLMPGAFGHNVALDKQRAPLEEVSPLVGHLEQDDHKVLAQEKVRRRARGRKRAIGVSPSRRASREPA